MNQARYVKTDTVLDRILNRKVEEVAKARHGLSLADLRAKVDAMTAQPLDFCAALRRETVALIAEVKKASPSKGVLLADFDHRRLSRIYRENGASALSVLTDRDFFQGDLEFLSQVMDTVSDDCPVVPRLRKDFIIDAYQVYEARLYGADAVLLIVAALDDAQLADLYQQIVALNMMALVEVHNEAELDRAMKINPQVIGVNNRDLKTFDVDLGTTGRVARQLPDSVTLVAESGIFTAADVATMAGHGAHAILVGEALVTAPNIAVKVRELSGVMR